MTAARRHRVAGLHPNVVQALLCLAGFCCCIPMSVPQAHLVAFCSDIGISPARSAVMLSVMLASAFLARQARGALADRIGGVRPLPPRAALPAATLPPFPLAPDGARLFALAAPFDLGVAR